MRHLLSSRIDLLSNYISILSNLLLSIFGMLSQLLERAGGGVKEALAFRTEPKMVSAAKLYKGYVSPC